MTLIDNFIKNIILKDFFKIELDSVQSEIAKDSIKNKYSKAVAKALGSGLLIIPAILFLNTQILVSILIPITMVSGTAWFAISLANLKKKFEQFGLELTQNLFDSFMTSLVVLGLLAFFSFFASLFSEIVIIGQQDFTIQLISAILGIIVVFRILYNLFAGSLKYDINDAMLTGQAEAAEQFFKKSLSLLHESANILQSGRGLTVANYHIGRSFYELFAFIRATGVMNGRLDALMKRALDLKRNPSMSQKNADAIAIELIENFVSYCINIESGKARKSFENLKDELNCLKNNKKEPQEVVDSRLSTIFKEIAELLEIQGEFLFKKK